MKHGSLFSGIGGFDLAAEWMGWENMFHCEWNPFCRKILKHYWKEAKSYEDITKTDFSIWRGRIDILTGGFPCQPYSTAGKQLGTEDERHLWPEMLRAIQEIQPPWVVGENVPGLVNWSSGLVFEQVQIDLENQGYEVIPFILPACGVDAPHKRSRVWFVAYSNSYSKRSSGEGGKIKSNRGKNNDEPKSRRTKTKQYIRCCNVLRTFTNPNIFNGDISGYGTGEISQFKTTKIFKYIITNSYSERQSRKEHREKKSRLITKKSLSNHWQNFPTQSPIYSGNDGLPSQLDGITFSKFRNESIKGSGNAIVPQVAHQIFKSINQFNNL